MRTEYTQGVLELADLDPNPITQLRAWIQDATQAQEPEPTAMCLATESAGRPSARMVLMRGLDQDGLTFFTNFESRKGRELRLNPHASVCFWWGRLERQVRVEGQVSKLSPDQADAYFSQRPRESQIASIVSPQSQVIRSRECLETATLEASDLTRPEHWGGFLLQPIEFEFWQGRPARLHDRFRYQWRVPEGWVIERLAP